VAQLIDSRSTRTEAPILCWRNFGLSGTASATNTATGYSAAAALTYAQYEGWQPTTDSSDFLVDLGTDTEIDYIAVVCNDAPDDAAISVGYSTDNGSSYTSIETSDCPPFWPAAFGVLLFVFDQASSVTNIRVVTRGCDDASGHSPSTFTRNTVLASNRSEAGGYLNRVVRRRAQSGQVALQNVTAADYRDQIDPFFVAAETQPFVFAWRPSTSAPTTITNPGFESGDTAWSLPGGGEITITNSLGTPRTGSWCARALNTNLAGTREAASTALAIQPGDLVFAGGWFRKASGAGNGTVSIRWAETGTFVTGSDVATSSGTYEFSRAAGRAPDYGGTAELYAVIEDGAGACDFSIDDTVLIVESLMRAQRLQEVSFGWMGGSPQMSNARPNGMTSIQFAFTGLAQ
jgi:hypothetical protein